MTLDRDIRFTPDQIIVTQRALRDEIAKRDRSIRKAEQTRHAGGRIQQGVLDSHYRERDAARAALNNLEVARKQIGHVMRDRLGITDRA